MMRGRRALTLADEQMDDVKIYDVRFSDAQKLWEQIEEQGDGEVSQRLHQLNAAG
jgi:hypothetical protein